MNRTERLSQDHYQYCIPKWMSPYCGYAGGKMTVNGVSTIFYLASVTLQSDWLQRCINDELDAFIGKREIDMLPVRLKNWVSIEYERLLVLEVRQLLRDYAILMHTESIGRLYTQKRNQHTPTPIMKMNVNCASPIFGLASWLINARCGC
jgi:hypothetical protein